jgi:OPT family oligopeptide transporter
MPIWAVVFSCVMCLIFTIPTSIVAAVTNYNIGLNVVTELIGGYAFPGRPIANMLFKTFGYNTSAQAQYYAQDLKLGHYCKIPPRSMFWAQFIATLWSSLVCLGVVDWQINSVEGICEPNQPDKFTCRATYQVFYGAAVQWGAIGPQRLYGEGRVYNNLLYGFLLGGLAPIPVYFLARKYPMSFWKYVNVPTIFAGALSYAPYNISYYIQPLALAVVFQIYIRRRATAWWLKYNYITSVALSASAGIWAVIWFFALNYVNYTPDWWGNDVSYTGCEGDGGCPWYDLPEQGYFGPGVGEFSFN